MASGSGYLPPRDHLLIRGARVLTRSRIDNERSCALPYLASGGSLASLVFWQKAPRSLAPFQSGKALGTLCALPAVNSTAPSRKRSSAFDRGDQLDRNIKTFVLKET